MINNGCYLLIDYTILGAHKAPDSNSPIPGCSVKEATMAVGEGYILSYTTQHSHQVMVVDQEALSICVCVCVQDCAQRNIIRVRVSY